MWVLFLVNASLFLGCFASAAVKVLTNESEKVLLWSPDLRSARRFFSALDSQAARSRTGERHPPIAVIRSPVRQFIRSNEQRPISAHCLMLISPSHSYRQAPNPGRLPCATINGVRFLRSSNGARYGAPCAYTFLLGSSFQSRGPLSLQTRVFSPLSRFPASSPRHLP